MTEGLYAHTRSPTYVGNLLILVGVAIAADSWALVATHWTAAWWAKKKRMIVAD